MRVTLPGNFIAAMRQTISFRNSLLIGLLAQCLLSGCSHQTPYTVKPTFHTTKAPKVALYSDRGVARNPVIATHHMLSWMGMSVETVDSDHINRQGLKGFDLLCVPGGNMYLYSRCINETGKANILRFVENGGGYLGICGGAYYAAEKVRFFGFTIPMAPLGLFQGVAISPVRGVGFIKRRMCTVEQQPGSPLVLPDSPKKHSILYILSPGLLSRDATLQQTVLKYSNSELAAAVSLHHGKGRVFLIGLHPEIEEDDARDHVDYVEHLDDRGSDWPLMRAAVNWCLDRD